MITVLVTALEASGDALGADLMRVLKRRLPEVRFVGVGGAEMQAEGLSSAFDIAELSVVGLLDGLMAYRRADRRAAEIAALAAREAADIAVMIDSWGFSYLLARRLRRAQPGLPLVKYVAPQVWATRPGRAKALARSFDRLLSIIAFETPLFEAAGAKVTFVGHPALADDIPEGNAERLRERIGAAGGEPILLVLPGSRNSEVSRLMPPFEGAVARLKAIRPELHVVVAAAPTVANQVVARTAGWPFRSHLIQDAEGRRDAMAAADVALACSGTVTTELAVAGCPMVVAYRLGPATYAIAKRIVRTRFITLINIAADQGVAPELIQDDCTGRRLANELARRLDDPAFREAQAAAQTAALEKLGGRGPPPAVRAAEAILGMLNPRS
ncbi:MAG TPA: lipid-A-disaccharide synthase [Caulobacteraceae bacterium]|nr:lipid-A-disaccharide synthase [Caulobacteraceae bacterium]